MSFSVSDGRDFEYASHGPNGLFANRRHLADPRFLRMVAEYARFNRDAKALLASDEEPSLRGWLADLGYSDGFVERLIVPQAAAVWSADPEQLWEFPARFLVQFFDNHGMLGIRERPRWRTVVGGRARYVDAIGRGWAAGCGSQRRSSEIERHADGVALYPAGGRAERFDEVVLAMPQRPGHRGSRRSHARRARIARRVPRTYRAGGAPHRRAAAPAAAAPPGRAGTTTAPTDAGTRRR